MDSDQLRARVQNDLTILANIRALVGAGKIIPVAMPEFCPHCLTAAALGPKAMRRYTGVVDGIRSQFLNNMSLTISKKGKMYGYEYECPESLLPHGGGGATYASPPPGLRKMPRLLRRIDAGEEVTLSKAARSRVRFHIYIAERVIEDIMFQVGNTYLAGTSVLTDSELHADFLSSLAAKRETKKRNELIRKHLTAIVPFVDGVSGKNLLRLRQREPEAFILFRQSLNAAVGAVHDQREGFTESDARAIYGDIIAPRLALLDAKVKTARKGLLKSAGKKSVTWAGIIGFGMFSGIVPAEVAQAVSAFGLANIGADIVGKILGIGEVKEQFRSENMYFLWRVREMASKS